MSMEIGGNYDYYKNSYAGQANMAQEAQRGQNEPAKAPQDQIAGSGEPEQKCTGNTDAVDREIERLKEEKEKLKQQLRAASDDEEKARELEKRLAQVESELAQKDNDEYRRRNTSFSALA